MKIRHKILLTTLSTLILSGPVVLGLVSALVIKNPDTPTPPTPPKPIDQEYKKIGNYNAEATESDDYPAIYILKSKESTDENVLRFMEIKVGSSLQNTYDCIGWTVFGTKIETSNITNSSYNLAIDENTIPQTILINNVEKSIVNIGRFNDNAITSIVVPNFIVTIGDSAFNGCSGLTTLDLSRATRLETIGNNAFDNCIKLTDTLTIPTSVTSIGASAFSECSSLTGLDLSNATSLVTIGGSAFAYCSGLTGNLIIPSSLTSIAVGDDTGYNSAFFWGPHFTSISVESTNPKYALASKKSVGAANVVIDKTLTPDSNYDYSYIPIGALSCGELTIDNDPKFTVLKKAFVFATGITSIIVQENIEQIYQSFSNCSSLETLDLSKATNLNGLLMDNFSALPSSFYDCPKLSGTLVIPKNLLNIQTANPTQLIFNESLFSSLNFKAAIPSNNIDYEKIFNATITQAPEKYTITVPVGSKALYQAKFPSVPVDNIIEG